MCANSLYGLIQDEFGENKLEAGGYSGLALAYIGDAFYEVIVRTCVMRDVKKKVNVLHREATQYVRAGFQAKLIKTIEDELTREEADIYHKGRNAQSHTMAKNASAAEYRLATGFEAVMGYLYMQNNEKRALELIKLGFRRVNERENDEGKK
ncbi:MAG: ribonuclease III domain-containing protein [Lachnospiraceae bacterium]|jgi:ribonuclease-3 family protein|nr:ribonuclease III domain-containing protein [Lachnospiraceae bacterium]MEE3461887.1 ribonuclease III domain-containing protein [Lachnospiraceae bacterium]